MSLSTSKKIIVIDEHTLGYIDETMMDGYAGVLRASVLRGATSTSNIAIICNKKIRLANKTDFDTYRVSGFDCYVKDGYEFSKN